MSLKRLMPALLQSTCTLPRTRSVSSAARAKASRSVTSSWIAWTSPSSSAVAASRWSGRMSAIATFMPAPRNALAIPSPTPLPPPVTNATLPSTSRTAGPYSRAGMAATTVRADVVGSLLRREYLREARNAARTGGFDPGELHALEDRAVLEAIALQESAGIEAITDGEYRRTGWIAFIPMVDDPLFEAPVSGFEFLNAASGWRGLWKTGAGEPADTSALPPEEPFVTRRLQVES